MILVETVIRKLIVDYEFVILPGFGALLSHQIPALYNQETGIFSPPSKKLAFNESLKLDDGLLANYISREESIAHLEAVAYIKKYVEAIKKDLHQQGNAMIKGIGTFHTNGEGKLVFDPGTGKYFKDEWYGLKPISATLVSHSDPIVSQEAIDVVEIASKPFNQLAWGRWIAAACVLVALCLGSITLVQNSPANLSNLNPITLIFGQSVPAVADRPVVVEAKPVAAPRIEVEEPLAPVASAPIDPKEGTLEEAHVLLPSSGYYVIAGTFKDEKRANMLLERLQKKGYASAQILPKEKNSTKLKVAVNKFEGEYEAYRVSAQLKSVIGEPGWVYYKKK
jgi:nucleoid DNA-binding protein